MSGFCIIKLAFTKYKLVYETLKGCFHFVPSLVWYPESLGCSVGLHFLCMYSGSDWTQCWDVRTFLLLQLSSCGFVLFISYISLTSVHLLFLQWRFGGIFECLMFTVCIAGLFCLHLQVHLYLMLLKGGVFWHWFVSAARQLMNELWTVSSSVLSLWLMMMDLIVSALLFLFRMKD